MSATFIANKLIKEYSSGWGKMKNVGRMLGKSINPEYLVEEIQLGEGDVKRIDLLTIKNGYFMRVNQNMNDFEILLILSELEGEDSRLERYINNIKLDN